MLRNQIHAKMRILSILLIIEDMSVTMATSTRSRICDLLTATLDIFITGISKKTAGIYRDIANKLIDCLISIMWILIR